nr:DUF1993 domain-containing protein [Sphingomonas sp. Y57]
MTTTTLYEASIPVIRRSLANLSTLLDKGAEHFAAAGVAEAEWLDYRLADDMYPLLRQVQVASDGAKGAAARLAGQTPPSFPDEEKSVAELRDRIARTIAYLDSVPAAAIAGREEAPIVLEIGDIALHFTGASYVRDFALPNLLFHVTTVYAILRNRGVPLGKRDFLGEIDIRPRVAA